MFAKLSVKDFLNKAVSVIKRSGFALNILLLLLIASCSPSQPEKKFRIGFSQCTIHDVWRQSMIREMERELSFHSEVDFILKEANLNSELQVEQIKELIDQKIDLLIVSRVKRPP